MANSKFSSRRWLLIIFAIVMLSLIWNLVTDNKQMKDIKPNPNNESLADKLQNEELQDSGERETGTGGQCIDDNNDNNQSQTPGMGESKPQTDEDKPVYIVGAVKRPGIYKIDEKTCLYELIELAGGMTESAAFDRINLAAEVNSNQLIRIPTEEEWLQNPEQAVIVEQNDAIGVENDRDSDLIDINRADANELETLPGVGPATAKAIIDYRTKQGTFASIEDIMRVPGIKESRFAQLCDYITV